MASTVLAKMAVEISANSAEFTKAMSSTEKQLSAFAKSASNVAAAVGLSFSAFAAVSVLKGAINTIADFEHQMQVVKAITGATGKEFKALEKNAVDLGASTRYTAKQVAELQTEYGRLGFTTDEILAATAATLDLATATGENLAKSADVAGSTVRGFGLSADETRRVVDVMAESFNRSALGLENFSEAMKYVAPIAAQANISVEETTALLGTLADAGIRGSQAGTSLRKIMTDIGGESGTLSERLQKLAAKGLTGAEAMSEVGRTAYASLLVLVENTKKTDNLTKSLENAAGAGAKAAKIMGDDLSGDLVLLSSAYDGLILSFKNGSGVLRSVVQSFTSILTSVTSVLKSISDPDQANFIQFQRNLADAISNDSAPAIKTMVKELNLLRVKLDQPIDESFITQLSDQYKLTQEQSDRFIKIIREINGEIKKTPPVEVVSTEQNQKIIETRGLIQQLEDKLKEVEEKKKASFSTKEIGEFNNKIKELRDEIAVLNATGSESGFLKNLEKNLTLGIKTEIKEPENKPLESPFSTTLDIDVQPYKDKLAEAAQAQDAFGKGNQESTDQMIARQQALVAQQEKQNQTALQFGEVVGDSFARAATGQITFKQALKNTTQEILKMFLQRALAGVVAGAAGTTAPPPVILALAAAGMAGVMALFSSFGGPSSGGGGAGSTLPRTNVSKVTPEPLGNTGPERMEFVIHGEDLVTLASSQNKRNERLKG